MGKTIPLLVADETTLLNRRRDTMRPVFLVGFQQQGNLGLGYLASTLEQYGYRVVLFDFERDPDEIRRAAISEQPVLIGFSLIFQFYVFRFGSLIDYLRRSGVDCHFTMGGHFPSLSYEQTIDLLPNLDSVVRFEGEHTLLELADRLSTGVDWHDIDGLAFRQGEEIVANPLRTLLPDLDSLPHPKRDFEPESVLGHMAMPLLASRGCSRTCSFCSIHRFYRIAPGKVVRTRSPRKVVEEMVEMHEQRGVTIFLFQDDDFPLYGPVWRRWTLEFLDELHRAGLPGKAIWKINCRADSIDRELFQKMRDAGLYLVYIGLESGSEDGLDTLAKGITVEQNLRAVSIIRELDIMLEFGFMMFDPSTTFESIEENVRFLETITSGGSAAAVFCRMLPYDGTPIKTDLEEAGRLRGDVVNPDYDFLDPRIGSLYEEINHRIHVTGWIHGYRALSPQINWAWNEVAVLERLFPPLPGMDEYKAALRAVTSESNDLLFGLVKGLTRTHELGGTPVGITDEELERQTSAFLDRLVDTRDRFIVQNQETLLRSLGKVIA